MKFSLRRLCSALLGSIIILILIALNWSNNTWFGEILTSTDSFTVRAELVLNSSSQLMTSTPLNAFPGAGKQNKLNQSQHSVKETKYFNERLFVCVVCCGGDRLNETQTALKSAVIFSSSPLTLLVFTQPEHHHVFTTMWESWPASVKERVSLSLQEAKYPASVDEAQWRGLFAQCASLRLFLPALLPTTHALLYLDTDVVLVSALESVWSHLHLFNSSQLAAVAPEHQDSAAGWYNRFAKHPYYGKLGINSGVMLMELSRMRAFGWADYIVPLKEQYEQHLRWGDQDLLNILFHFHPELVYLWDCSYNYRPDHCMYGGSACEAVQQQQWRRGLRPQTETGKTETGVRVLHANRGSAHSDKFPPFRDVHAAIHEFNIGHDRLYEDLYEPLASKLRSLPAAKCSKAPEVYTNQMQLYAKHV